MNYKTQRSSDAKIEIFTSLTIEEVFGDITRWANKNEYMINEVSVILLGDQPLDYYCAIVLWEPL